MSKEPDLPSYLCGDVVELTATPDQDWVFGAWSGDLTGNTNPVTITMDGDKVVEAAFGTLDGPTITVWYGLDQTFGLYGQPQRWVNILGNVTDPDGVSSLTYSLNGSFPPVTLRLGPDGRRLASSGDFNADLDIADLLSGLNTLVLTATDGFGNVSIETVTINYFADTVWPQPYVIDWSTLTIPEEIQDVGQVCGWQVADGKWKRAH